MNALNLHPSAADQDTLLATLRAERAGLVTQLHALAGNGWAADVEAAMKGQASGYSAEADVQAVLDGQPLASPKIAADLQEKRRRFRAVDAGIKKLESERAQREVAALQVEADAATGDLRSMTAAALALGGKYRAAIAGLQPLIDRLTDAMHSRDCLRAADVMSLPGLRHDPDLEAVAGALMAAGEYIEAAQKAWKG